MGRFATLVAIVGVLAGALLLALAVPAEAKRFRQVDSALDRGESAFVIASAFVTNPEKFKIKVTTSPPTRIAGDRDPLARER